MRQMLIFIYCIYSRQNFIHSINSENHDHENDSNNCLKRKNVNWNVSAKDLRCINLQTGWEQEGSIRSLSPNSLKKSELYWERYVLLYNPKFHFVKVDGQSTAESRRFCLKLELKAVTIPLQSTLFKILTWEVSL